MYVIGRVCTLQTVILLAVSVVVMRSMIMPAARSEILSYTQTCQPAQAMSRWCRTVLPGDAAVERAGGQLRYIATELTTGLVDALLVFAFLSALLLHVLLKFKMHRDYAWMLWIPVTGLAGAILQSGGTAYMFYGSHGMVDVLTPWIRICGMLHTMASMFTLISAALLVYIHRQTRMINTR